MPVMRIAIALILIAGTIAAQQQQQPAAPVPAILENYKPVKKMLPDWDWVYIFIAECYDGLGQMDSAKEELKQAIELNPDHAWGWYLKGALIARDHRLEEAEPLLTRAIELEATMPSFWYNRGLVRAALGRKKGALADYEEAIRLGHPQPDMIRQRIDDLKRP